MGANNNLAEAKQIENISRSSFSSKECWSLYKSVIGINKDSSYPSLIDNGQVVVDDELKANTFNRLLSRNAFVDDSGKDLPDGVNTTGHSNHRSH